MNSRTIIATLWDAYGRECVLSKSDGQYDLLLRFKNGHTTQLETCRNEIEAKERAQSWLDALKTLPPERG